MRQALSQTECSPTLYVILIYICVWLVNGCLVMECFPCCMVVPIILCDGKKGEDNEMKDHKRVPCLVLNADLRRYWSHCRSWECAEAQRRAMGPNRLPTAFKYIVIQSIDLEKAIDRLLLVSYPPRAVYNKPLPSPTHNVNILQSINITEFVWVGPIENWDMHKIKTIDLCKVAPVHALHRRIKEVGNGTSSILQPRLLSPHCLLVRKCNPDHIGRYTMIKSAGTWLVNQGDVYVD